MRIQIEVVGAQPQRGAQDDFVEDSGRSVDDQLRAAGRADDGPEIPRIGLDDFDLAFLAQETLRRARGRGRRTRRYVPGARAVAPARSPCRPLRERRSASAGNFTISRPLAQRDRRGTTAQEPTSVPRGFIDNAQTGRVSFLRYSVERGRYIPFFALAPAGWSSRGQAFGKRAQSARRPHFMSPENDNNLQPSAVETAPAQPESANSSSEHRRAD